MFASQRPFGSDGVSSLVKRSRLSTVTEVALQLIGYDDSLFQVRVSFVQNLISATTETNRGSENISLVRIMFRLASEICFFL